MATTAQKNADRQQTLAHMVASGQTLVQAATQLGLTIASAQVIARSPLFNALVQKYQREQSLPFEERLQARLDEVVEDTLLPGLVDDLESEIDSVRDRARAKFLKLYEITKSKDKKALEGVFSIYLSDRESDTLKELLDMQDKKMAVPSANELIEVMAKDTDG